MFQIMKNGKVIKTYKRESSVERFMKDHQIVAYEHAPIGVKPTFFMFAYCVNEIEEKENVK